MILPPKRSSGTVLSSAADTVPPTTLHAARAADDLLARRAEGRRLAAGVVVGHLALERHVAHLAARGGGRGAEDAVVAVVAGEVGDLCTGAEAVATTPAAGLAAADRLVRGAAEEVDELPVADEIPVAAADVAAGVANLGLGEPTLVVADVVRRVDVGASDHDHLRGRQLVDLVLHHDVELRMVEVADAAADRVGAVVAAVVGVAAPAVARGDVDGRLVAAVLVVREDVVDDRVVARVEIRGVPPSPQLR